MARQINGLFIEADHRRVADCERSVSETVAAFGRIDILFNNAGMVGGGAIVNNAWASA